MLAESKRPFYIVIFLSIIVTCLLLKHHSEKVNKAFHSFADATKNTSSKIYDHLAHATKRIPLPSNPEIKIVGRLQNNKNYVIIGATIPRGKNIHYTWYIPVTARVWNSKGFIPIVFLAGSLDEWNKNVLAKIARDEVLTIENAVVVNIPCKLEMEKTIAQVSRIVGLGNLIDVSNALDSYFITTDVDLWPLNITRHLLPDEKDVVITRALSGLKGCCQVSIALSCVGAKGKTWRDVTTFSDCSREKTNPKYYEDYCASDKVYIKKKDRYLDAKNIRTAHDSAEKILKFAAEFKGDVVTGPFKEDDPDYTRVMWFLDQSLATIIFKMWTERNIQKGGSAYNTTAWFPKKVERLDRGKGWQPLHEDNFDAEDFQDAHLPRLNGHLEQYERSLKPLMKELLDEETIKMIDSYQRHFEYYLPQWRYDFGLPTK